MGELWRDLVDMLRRHPLLWLPVLLADLLGYLLNLGRGALLKAVVLHETAQRSVLGGAVVHAPMSAATLQHATLLALLLSWFTYFVRILLYSGALVATATLIAGYLRQGSEPVRAVAPTLRTHWGGILELTLRGLAIYAVAALLFSLLSNVLLKHGYTAVLQNPWFGFTLGLLVLLVLAAFLAPVALRVLADRAPDSVLGGLSQQLAAVLAVVVSVLALFVSANSREMAHIPPAVRYPVEAVGSLVVALPFVMLFTGLALLARRMAKGEMPVEPTV